MNFPIPTSELWQYIPHRPPMVWIDEVLSVTETGSDCCVHIKETEHYFDKNGVRPTSCIEWIAQAYAFGSLARQLNSGPGAANNVSVVSNAFLVGVNDFVVSPREKFPKSGPLIVRVKLKRELPPLVIFEGKVLHPNGEELARASIKVFASA